MDMSEVNQFDTLQFVSLNEKYKAVQKVLVAIIYIMILGLGLFLLLSGKVWICIAFECLVLASAVINISFISKAYLCKGYALDVNGISYRSGYIFPQLTTVPYSKIQQVSIKQNPVSRLYHLYAVEIVNGA